VRWPGLRHRIAAATARSGAWTSHSSVADASWTCAPPLIAS
jgi:hypothetical protein